MFQVTLRKTVQSCNPGFVCVCVCVVSSALYYIDIVQVEWKEERKPTAYV